MIHIQKINDINSEMAEQAFDIRKKVFVVEQNVDTEDEFDEFEKESTHFLLKLNKNPIGTARWRIIGEKIKLERFAVLQEFRNGGYGNILLSAILEDVVPRNREIYLHAQLKAIPFYERQGFIKVGDEFKECNILHYKMLFQN